MPSTLTIITITVVVLYFALLFVIARLTTRKSIDNQTFFLANRESPWYVVAFGMVGTTFSGVTFISVPGWVGATEYSYFQMVIGYIAGYSVIALILMPLYYRLNLTSIYRYLQQRIGVSSYKTGSAFFLLSRSIGAAFRLYLIAIVFQIFVFREFNIPFYIAVLFTLLLIWIYTHRGGIKTIVYTDTLQTALMLFALIVSIGFLTKDMGLNFSNTIATIHQSDYSQLFFWDWRSPEFFPKQFLSGMFIAIVMTGLDQDMMQKNLSCANLRAAQKNMFSFTVMLVIVKFVFISLGALLFIYANQNGITIPEKSDYLYPQIAFDHFPVYAGVVFILGLTASAYSSADSALTALTTAFCVDFLGFEEKQIHNNKRTRYIVHLCFTFLIFLIIMFFHYLNDKSVISKIFQAASYTYGPLLGMFSFGIFMKKIPIDRYVPFICIISPIISFIMDYHSKTLFGGYEFSFELLLVNGLITFAGLYLISNRKHEITN